MRRSHLVVYITLVFALLAATLVIGSSPNAFWPQTRPDPPSFQTVDNAVGFLVVFGRGDKEPSTWEGRVSLRRGRIVRLEGWRFEGEDKILPENSWRFSTRRSVPQPDWLPSQWRDAPSPPIVPNGVVVTTAGSPEDEVLVETGQGDFSFALANTRLGTKLTFLNGRAEVEGVPATRVVAGGASENDEPSLTVSRAGDVWVAWVAYSNGADSVQAKRLAGGRWSEAMQVADRGHQDLFKTAIAEDGSGRIWVVWSSQVGSNWDLYGRAWNGKRWSKTERITQDPSPDLFHRLVADSSGKLYLAWQGFRRGRSTILLKVFDGAHWSAEIPVSEPGVNSWDPALAVDDSGRAYLAWDAYANDNFDIFLRSYAKGELSELIPVTRDPKFQAHVDVACDREGRVWLAWDESGVRWGKDVDYRNFRKGEASSLWDGRTVRLVCWERGVWKRPAADLYSSLPEGWERLTEIPKLAPDASGRLWLFFRHRALKFQATRIGEQKAHLLGRGARWDVFATSYSGGAWGPLISVPNSSGRNDVRLAALAARDGSVWAGWASDQRPWDTLAPQRSAVFLAHMDPGDIRPARPVLRDGKQVSVPPVTVSTTESEAVARLRDYKLSVGGRSYRIFRGDLHRHTDISFDGFGDGTLLDLYRYAIDAARLDFVAVTDHGAGQDREYPWWQTQKSADLFFIQNIFVPLYGYERSLSYPNGHRNVIFARRGIRTLPASQAEGAGTEGAAKLFAHLKANQGISIPHTSATEMGTDWRDNDPEVEPLVEIFQGVRASYEYAGAPRSEIKDYPNFMLGQLREKGFIWNAWAKGYKLGVEASSDHGSTHVSYACLYATSLSREALLDAIRRRHSYAATDNIIMDFRMNDKSTGEHMMGDIFTTAAVPTLFIRLIGTGKLKQVDVIKNNTFVYTAKPERESFEVQFLDKTLAPGEAYYYLRAEQEDGQLAWSSPIWVNYRP